MALLAVDAILNSISALDSRQESIVLLLQEDLLLANV